MQTILLAALIWTWPLTPETLVFVDRGSGLSGPVMIAFLGLGCVLALLCSSVIHDRRLLGSGEGNDYRVMCQVWGKFASMTLVFGGRIPLLLLASTGMLVTAGFAFNEIFLYWFPNFLFASLLLAAIGLVNLRKERLALSLQATAAILTVAAFFTLIFWGVFGNTMEGTGRLPATGQGFDPSLLALGFVPFLGFDFHRSPRKNPVVYVSLGAVFLLLSLWVLLVVDHVSAEALATADVAYMFAARSVAGEEGRYIMGVAIIGGVVCGVNGLFIVVRRCFEDIADELRMPKDPRLNGGIVAVFVVVIEIMMLTGVAGHGALKLLIQASIILWLCYLLFRVLAGGYLLRQKGSLKGWLGYGLAPLLVLMVILLALQHGVYLLVFLPAAVMAAALLSLAWLKAAERLKKNSSKSKGGYP